MMSDAQITAQIALGFLGGMIAGPAWFEYRDKKVAAFGVLLMLPGFFNLVCTAVFG